MHEDDFKYLFNHLLDKRLGDLYESGDAFDIEAVREKALSDALCNVNIKRRIEEGNSFMNSWKGSLLRSIFKAVAFFDTDAPEMDTRTTEQRIQSVIADSYEYMGYQDMEPTLQNRLFAFQLYLENHGYDGIFSSADLLKYDVVQTEKTADFLVA